MVPQLKGKLTLHTVNSSHVNLCLLPDLFKARCLKEQIEERCAINVTVTLTKVQVFLD